MAPRLELQALLVDLLGSNNVYFQPPPSVVMQYPCIIYHREYIKKDHADNVPYKRMRRYMVTVVDRDPDSPIVDKIAALPLCIYDRPFTADGLNHDVFRIFF